MHALFIGISSYMLIGLISSVAALTGENFQLLLLYVSLNFNFGNLYGKVQ